MKISTVNCRQTHVSPVQGHDRNERADEEAFLSASVGTIAHSLGERALMVTLAHETDFSEIMSLAVHPIAKHGLALRLRTLCRRALPLGSSLHKRSDVRLLREEQGFHKGYGRLHFCSIISCDSYVTHQCLVTSLFPCVLYEFNDEAFCVQAASLFLSALTLCRNFRW